MPKACAYLNTVGHDVESLVRRFNDLCGSSIVNPRPDLHGNYLITDLDSYHVLLTSNATILVGLVVVEPLDSSSGVVEQAGVRTPASIQDFFNDSMDAMLLPAGVSQ